MARKVKTRHFKSPGAYHRWIAYKSIHLPMSHSRETVVIAGRPHKVKHGR
jgi:hypothetical protein